MKFAITKCLSCNSDWTPNDQNQCSQCHEEKITEYLCAACNFYHPHDSYPAKKCLMCNEPVCYQCIKMQTVHLVHPCKGKDRTLQAITCSDKVGPKQDCKKAFLNLLKTTGQPPTCQKCNKKARWLKPCEAVKCDTIQCLPCSADNRKIGPKNAP